MILEPVDKRKLLYLSYEKVMAITTIPELVDWESLCKKYNMDIHILESFPVYIDWVTISSHQCLSMPFIEKYKDRLHMMHISKYQKLSEDFIKNNVDILWLPAILLHQDLSNEFRCTVEKISLHNARREIKETMYTLLTGEPIRHP